MGIAAATAPKDSFNSWWIFDFDDQMTVTTPSPEDIRRELQHILSSPDLQASEKRREFLKFIVEETLAGRSARLKGYTIAVAVFGRDESFDAQSDPVVRVEARRLRRDLDSYYMNAGAGDSVRISVPKGAYVPHFELLGTPHPPANSNQVSGGAGRADHDALKQVEHRTADSGNRGFRRYKKPASFALVLTVISLAIWLLNRQSSPESQRVSSEEPAVAVLPFEMLSPTGDNRYLAAGISQELISDLMQFPGFRVYDLTKATETTVNPGLDILPPIPEAAYLVSGNIRENARQVHLVAQMVLAETEEVLWSKTFDKPMNPNAMIQLQSELAAEIATALGQPYGYIHQDLKSRFAAPEISSMQSYICLLRAYDYRRNFSPKQFGPILSCLEKAVQDDPRYSDAWAMLGWLHLDAGRYEFYGEENIQREYEIAYEAASRAVSLEPDNTLALKALSSIDHYMGNYEESQHLARRAAELNPNDPDTLAQLGWRLAVRGNFKEGIPILRKAIDRTVNPPGWYYHLVAIDLYLTGNYEEMLDFAQRSAVDGSGFSQALIAIADGALGDGAGARTALKELPESGLVAKDLGLFLRRHGATNDIVAALTAGMAQAQSVAHGMSG